MLLFNEDKAPEEDVTGPSSADRVGLVTVGEGHADNGDGSGGGGGHGSAGGSGEGGGVGVQGGGGGVDGHRRDVEGGGEGGAGRRAGGFRFEYKLLAGARPISARDLSHSDVLTHGPFAAAIVPSPTERTGWKFSKASSSVITHWKNKNALALTFENF